MPLLYIGSDEGRASQHQIARRHATEQTSVTLGVADYDPTVRGALTGGNPYQQRWRDSTLSAIGANQQWARKRLSINELGVADYDPTIRQPWAEGSAYLRPAPRQPDAITATNAWARLRLTTNDLGLSDADATVKPPWADGEAFYWPAPRQPDAITASNQWERRRLSTNELGSSDADPTIKPTWQAANPYQLRWRDPTVQAIEAVEQFIRTRLTSNDLGLTDADPTVKPLWAAANPWQLRAIPNDLPAITGMLAQYHLWEASTPTDVSLDADPTVTIRPRQDPYHLRWRETRIPQRLLPFGSDVDADPVFFARRQQRQGTAPNSPAFYLRRIPFGSDIDVDPLLFPRRLRPWTGKLDSGYFVRRAFYTDTGTIIVLPDPTPYLTFHHLDGRTDHDLDGTARYRLEGRKTYRRRP